ncbi:tetratricopeptide repeat protein [Kovacikia minuta CCNUW1]|uniref:toll/interleukin-1 receptor domain-containing protein n=1 Tax=Kovacikia minuta TaxID=2931930 RepID=UPI001CCD5576|nr:toll/interleukin-1 receptor domain-containing protein [Kovacikia minuta]UBF27568.1 tetratricopeptide repeat protein [Kovacikia minuta CCNUW1]
MADSAVLISSSTRDRVDHDVFISYSRRDSEFVRRLLNRLQGENRDAWVDLQSIEAAEDFWQAIEIGIEAANAFIFILSPDSVASAYCNKEIDHAVQHNKRLIPVVCRNVEAAAVHGALRPLDWIFLRETDAFDPAFARLMRAIDTDLPYVRMHTRLQVKAIEWNKRGRDDSFLLRKSDLSDAESWLASSHGKEPVPTPLQQAYIATSRTVEDDYNQLLARGEQARRRVKLAAIVVPVAVAIAVGAGIVAMLKSNEAVNATQTAKNAKARQQDAEGKALNAERLQRDAEGKARDAIQIAADATQKAKDAEGKRKIAEGKLTDAEAKRRDAQLKADQALRDQSRIQAKLEQQKGELTKISDDLQQKKQNIREIWRFGEAFAESAQGRPENGLSILKRVIEKSPRNTFAFFGRGYIYYQVKKYQESETEFQGALAIDRSDATAWVGLGVAQAAQEDHDRAIDAFRQAIKLDPKYASAYRNLGAVLIERKKLDEAVMSLRKAIELDPKDALAYTNLGAALINQKNPDYYEAIVYLKKAIELDPKLALAYTNLGAALTRQKKLDEALIYLKKAIELDPKLALAYNNLGIVLYEQGELDKAFAESLKWPQLVRQF